MKIEKQRIVKLIKGCNGHGFIRVDEAQKMGIGERDFILWFIFTMFCFSNIDALNMFSALLSPPYTIHDEEDYTIVLFYIFISFFECHLNVFFISLSFSIIFD